MSSCPYGTVRMLHLSANCVVRPEPTQQACGACLCAWLLGHQRTQLERRSCQREEGGDDLKKGTQLLEVYALEIQIATEQRNNKRLKQLYTRALGVKSAIPHPRVMGIIRECGGKMHMHERVWTDAATDFFEVRLWPNGGWASVPGTCVMP